MKHSLLIIALLASVASYGQMTPQQFAAQRRAEVEQRHTGATGKLYPIKDFLITKTGKVADAVAATAITVKLVDDNLATDSTAYAVFRVQYVAADKTVLGTEVVKMGWQYYVNEWDSNDNEATVAWVASQIKGVKLK